MTRLVLNRHLGGLSAALVLALKRLVTIFKLEAISTCEFSCTFESGGDYIAEANDSQCREVTCTGAVASLSQTLTGLDITEAYVITDYLRLTSDFNDADAYLYAALDGEYYYYLQRSTAPGVWIYFESQAFTPPASSVTLSLGIRTYSAADISVDWDNINVVLAS